jgi:hypothetical protein
MKQLLIMLLLLAFAFSSTSDAQKRKVKAAPEPDSAFEGKFAIPCPQVLNDITDCPDTGCGPSLDPNLNKRKNIRSDDEQPVIRTLQYVKNLPDPVTGYRIGDPRDKLEALGEGQKVTVVAWALIARKGGGESCNCKLMSTADTNNFIVLVDPSLKRPTLANNEDDSVTAEITPRVRVDHPGLTRAALQPLITSTPGFALLVRITGLLMFDSEHSLGRHLRRHNNWEIHPVFRLEYCPNGKQCVADSDANWLNLEK